MSIEATEISAYQAPPPRKTEPEKSDESFDQHLAEAIDEPAPAKQDDTPVQDTAPAETADVPETDAPAPESDSPIVDTAATKQETKPEAAAPVVVQAPDVAGQTPADADPAPAETPAPDAPPVAAPAVPGGDIQEAAKTNVVAAAASGVQTQQPEEKPANPSAPVETSTGKSTTAPTPAPAAAATAAAGQAAQNTAPQPVTQNAKAKPNSVATSPAPQNNAGQTTLVSQVGKEVSQLLGNDDAAAAPPADPDAPETVISNAAVARTSNASAAGTAAANTAAAATPNANPTAVPTDRPQAGGEPATPAPPVPAQAGNAAQPANPAALPPVDMPTDTAVLPPVGGNSQPATVQPAAAQSAAASQQAAAHQPAAQQVAVQIAKAADDGIDRIRIQLNPAELGRVDVRLEVGHDGRVQAVVMADRPETLDMLRRDIAGLEKALADAGLKADTGGLSFSLRGDGDPGGFAGNGDDYGVAADGLEDDVPGPEIIAETGRLIAVDGALDIRV